MTKIKPNKKYFLRKGDIIICRDETFYWMALSLNKNTFYYRDFLNNWTLMSFPNKIKYSKAQLPIKLAIII